MWLVFQLYQMTRKHMLEAKKLVTVCDYSWWMYSRLLITVWKKQNSGGTRVARSVKWPTLDHDLIQVMISGLTNRRSYSWDLRKAGVDPSGRRRYFYMIWLKIPIAFLSIALFCCDFSKELYGRREQKYLEKYFCQGIIQALIFKK